MNPKKIVLICFLYIAHCNVHAMEKQTFYGIKKSVNILETSGFKTFTQTTKFQEKIKEPEFFILTHTSGFQALMKAIQSQSYDHIQEALEGLLGTEALKLIFETGIFSDALHVHYNILVKTDAYAEYKHIESCHKKWGTHDTRSVLNDCRIELRNTKEYQDLLAILKKEMFLTTSNSSSNQEIQLTRAEQDFLKEAQLLLPINEEQIKNSTSQIYSHNVIAKNMTMENSPIYQAYQQAKAYHEEHNNADSQAIFDICKEQFFASKECREFIQATSQEAHITHNIINSEKYKTEQKHSDQEFILFMQDNRNNAWKAAANTKEYKLFQNAQMAHKQHGTPLTQRLLDQCEQHAKETPEYIRYSKINQQLREAKAELQKNNGRFVRREYKANNNQSTINNNTTASSTPQPQSKPDDLNFQEQELTTYQNRKWLQEQIDKVRPDRNKALILYKNTRAYKDLEQARQQKPCHDTFLSIAKAQEKASTTKQADNFRELDAQLNYLRTELNKLIKNEYKPQNKTLGLSSNSNNNNAYAKEHRHTTQQTHNHLQFNSPLNYMNEEYDTLINATYKPNNQQLRLSNKHSNNNNA